MSIPFLPLYTSDFKADTAHLSHEERGIYIELLCLCWDSARGTIPADEAYLKRHARLSDEQFELAKIIISEFFTIKNNLLHNKRLLDERKKYENKVKINKKNGQKGGRPQNPLKNNEKNKANGYSEKTERFSKQNPKKRQPEPEPEPDLSEIGNPPISPPIISNSKLKDVDVAFDQFWRAYPNRKGKGAARKAFAKAIKLTTIERILAAIERYVATQDPNYFKNPATWLNQECWDDEHGALLGGGNAPADQATRILARQMGLAEQGGDDGQQPPEAIGFGKH